MMVNTRPGNNMAVETTMVNIKSVSFTPVDSLDNDQLGRENMKIG